MAEPDDMDDNGPITRGEFKTELAKLATKADLAASEGRLLAEIAAREQRLLVEMTALNAASERRLLDALGQHTAANQENLSGQVAVVDDKYKDLPERVTRLEAAVFKPRRRSRP